MTLPSLETVTLYPIISEPPSLRLGKPHRAASLLPLDELTNLMRTLVGGPGTVAVVV